MSFAIIDSSGNVLAWYDSQGPAQAALERMIEDAPTALDELVVIQFGDDGDPVGDAILPQRSKVVIEESPWLRPGQAVEYDEPPLARAGALRGTLVEA